MSQVILAIPARYAATRFPEKLLAQYKGKSIIQWCVERACAVKTALNAQVVVATDHDTIEAQLEHLPAKVILTSPELPSGTDRICRALEHVDAQPDDIIVNLQGDEPFFSIRTLKDLINHMKMNAHLPMASAVFQNRNWEDFISAQVVKVTRTTSGNACYFSRAPIPWPRALLGATGQHWRAKLENLNQRDFCFWQHLGIYAYRNWALNEFSHKLKPHELELTEGLEQLRAIAHGWQIGLIEAYEKPQGVDTPEDLLRLEERELTL